MKNNIVRTLLSGDPHIRWEEPSFTYAQKREMWNNIKKVTVKKNIASIFSLKRLLPVASVAVVVVLGVFVWQYLGEKSQEINYSDIMSNSEYGFDPTQGDVILTLSGNQSIKVLAEHADVVYNEEGTTTVNHMEIVSRDEENVKVDQLMVPYGKTASLTLSDGTKVWINAGSKLIYLTVFGKNKREVYLTGEAYFDVAKDENRPFIIKTGQLDVAVRGTSLNVMAYENEPVQKVVLVSGKVDVRSNGGKVTYKMEPEQLFSYEDALGEAAISNVDVDEYISWTEGYLLLQNESLDRLLARIERHYNVRIVYNAEDIRGIMVSGKLDLQKGINKMLEYISVTAPVIWKLENEEVVVKVKE